MKEYHYVTQPIVAANLIKKLAFNKEMVKLSISVKIHLLHKGFKQNFYFIWGLAMQ